MRPSRASAGRSAEDKARIVAESFEPGARANAVARRHALLPQQSCLDRPSCLNFSAWQSRGAEHNAQAEGI
jgi:hypothetical protein